MGEVLVDGTTKTIESHAEEYPLPDFNAMIQTTSKLLTQYDIRFDNRYRILSMLANPTFIGP